MQLVKKIFLTDCYSNNSINNQLSIDFESLLSYITMQKKRLVLIGVRKKWDQKIVITKADPKKLEIPRVIFSRHNRDSSFTVTFFNHKPKSDNDKKD